MTVYESVKLLLDRLCGQGKLKESDFCLEREVPLSQCTTFRTGGPATVLYPLEQRTVEALFPLLNQENIPYFLLGSGSNVIAKDEGYHGLILSFERLKKAEVKGNVICAQSGMSVTALANLAKKHSLMGMEFFYGIPGSVGGAVFMNAGAYGGECKNILKSVTFITREGQVMTLPTEQLQMGYRTSLFETNGAAILSAEFSLEKGDPLTIGKTMDELMEKRRTKQPLEYPSAGSTFKRCEGRFTAQMIDEAGLKGTRVGGAMVSEKHAGFIINYDHATSADIFSLIALVKETIFEKEKLHIECEVRVIQ